MWRAQVKPAKKVRVGETLRFFEAGQPALVAEVVEAGEFGERTLRFEAVEDFYGTLDRIGAMPLPPYILRDQRAQEDTAEDRERYQTVYSRQPGSAAAPTAGLHFTPQVLAALAARGFISTPAATKRAPVRSVLLERWTNMLSLSQAGYPNPHNPQANEGHSVWSPGFSRSDAVSPWISK